jgi:outer membrane protein assembly factor BamB
MSWLDESSVSPSSSPGRVFVGAADEIVSLNATDGFLQWIGSVPYSDSIVYQMSSNPVIGDYIVQSYNIDQPTFMAVNIQTGKVAWTYNFL